MQQCKSPSIPIQQIKYVQECNNKNHQTIRQYDNPAS